MARQKSRRRPSLNRTRSDLYRAARFLGDLEALKKGPEALLKRLVRRALWRETAGVLRRMLPDLF